MLRKGYHEIGNATLFVQQALKEEKMKRTGNRPAVPYLLVFQTKKSQAAEPPAPM